MHSGGATGQEGTAGDDATAVKPQVATPHNTPLHPLVLSMPFAPVDAMQHVLLWVYTGRADIPPKLVPAVWQLCQVLGVSPISRRVMQQVRAAAAKDAKAGRAARSNGLPASFHVGHKDVHWGDEALFECGRPLLGTPSMPHSQFTHAQCPLPLANIDTQLAKTCREQLNTKPNSTLSAAGDAVSAHTLVASCAVTVAPRHGNVRTLAALRWLLSEAVLTDVLVQTLVPAPDNTAEDAVLDSQAPPPVSAGGLPTVPSWLPAPSCGEDSCAASTSSRKIATQCAVCR